MNDKPNTRAGSAKFKSWAVLLLLAAIMALVFVMGWHNQLTLENIAEHRDALKEFLARHWILAPLIYVGVYIVAVALSLPSGFVLTLTGGLFFGWLLGSVLAVIGATIGATILFLIARSSVGLTLADNSGPWLAKLRGGFQKNAFSYLLFLRLVPAFPFWLVNIAPALLGVPLKTYVLATLIGIIPATFAFCCVGAGLDSVIVAAQAQYAACVAAGSPDCKLSLSIGSLVTKELLLAFVLLGLVALIPPIVRRWRTRNAAA